MIDEPLRIWHILETYPPGYGGGAAITTRDVCRALADRGHEVRVLCVEAVEGEPYRLRSEHDYDGRIRVDRVNLPFAANDPDGWFENKRRWRAHELKIDNLIRELIAGWRPDIADYHTARPLGEQCIESVARSGVPVVATLHDGWLICPRLMLLRSPQATACEGPSTLRCLECIYSQYDGSHFKAALKLPWRILKLGTYPAWRLHRRTDARLLVTGAIARSEFMAEVHRPHLMKATDHGCDISHIALGLDMKGLPEERPVRPRTPLRFGFVGGIQRTKGLWDVLYAAASLKRSGFAFELHIWGPGEEESQDEVASQGLETCVVVHGMFKPEDKWAVYAEIDVAIMATTVNEPFGRVPLEAAAMGAPTIAPAVGGIRETIRDGIDGLHYRFRDRVDLERQMRRVLEEPGLFDHLRSNLRTAPDTREQVPQVEAFYRRILERELGA